MAANLPNDPRKPRRRPVASARPQHGSETPEDRVTGRTAEVRQTLRVVKSSQDVRSARVAALRAQVRAGTYRADPELIARRIIEQGL